MRGPRGVPAAWVRLLRAHATLVRRMDANLLAEHELTINDYEVLLALSRADGRRMRRVDLASTVLLTQSGITRLLHGLERTGLVARASWSSHHTYGIDPWIHNQFSVFSKRWSVMKSMRF